MKSRAKRKRIRRRATPPNSNPVLIAGGITTQDLTRALKAVTASGHAIDKIEIIDGKIHISTTQNKPAVESGYFTIAQACTYGPIGRSKLYELIGARKIRTKKHGRRTLVSRASIDRYLKTLPNNQ